jgi:hypothetical protein
MSDWQKDMITTTKYCTLTCKLVRTLHLVKFYSAHKVYDNFKVVKYLVLSTNLLSYYYVRIVINYSYIVGVNL